MTTDKHPTYTKAIRWIVGRKVLHRHNQYINNRMEQNHRHIKQRYYPMIGFKQFESASRFCNAFDELRHYLKIRSAGNEHVPAEDIHQQVVDSSDRAVSINTEDDHVFGSPGLCAER